MKNNKQAKKQNEINTKYTIYSTAMKIIQKYKRAFKELAK